MESESRKYNSIVESINCHVLVQYLFTFIARAPPADGLAPFGTKPSAGTTVNKFVTGVCTRSVNEFLKQHMLKSVGEYFIIA